MSDKNKANNCLWEIAKVTEDETICESWIVKGGSDRVNKDLCYKNLARRKDDIKVCGSIKYDQIKEDCIRLFTN